MNDSESDDDDDEFLGIPPSVDTNPKMNMDDDVEEVTRKIAPSSSIATISLGALPTMPTTPGFDVVTDPMILTTHGPSSVMKVSSSMGQQQQHTQQRQKQEEETSAVYSSARCFVWKLRSVPTLPEFYHLERTAVFIPYVANNPSVVTERISAVLRERSIEAHYDDEMAKVKCLTVEGVDFRIRLYRGRARYNHGIIVEVQRRFGTSLVFHDDTQAILDGAQGNVLPSPIPLLTNKNMLSKSIDDDDDDEDFLPPPPLLKTNKNILPKIIDEDDEEDDEDFPPPPLLQTNTSILPKIIDEEDDDHFKDEDNVGVVSSRSYAADSSLAMVDKMLKVPGFDSQYLALQILSTMVDSEKLSKSSARAVATRLLQDDPTEQNSVGSQIIRRIIDNKNNEENKKKTRGVFDDDDDDEEDSLTLRNMCLNILAKSLRAYNNRTTAVIVPDCIRHCELQLRRVLLRDLEDAERYPNTALLSARCMEYFVTINDDDLEPFDIAEQVGEERHVELFRQAKRLKMMKGPPLH